MIDCRHPNVKLGEGFFGLLEGHRHGLARGYPLPGHELVEGLRARCDRIRLGTPCIYTIIAGLEGCDDEAAGVSEEAAAQGRASTAEYTKLSCEVRLNSPPGCKQLIREAEGAQGVVASLVGCELI